MLHGHVVAGGVDVEAAIEGLPRRAALGKDTFLYALVVGGLAFSLGIAEEIDDFIRLRHRGWHGGWECGVFLDQHSRGNIKLLKRDGSGGVKCRGILLEEDGCGGIETHLKTPLP